MIGPVDLGEMDRADVMAISAALKATSPQRHDLIAWVEFKLAVHACAEADALIAELRELDNQQPVPDRRAPLTRWRR